MTGDDENELKPTELRMLMRLRRRSGNNRRYKGKDLLILYILDK